MAEEMTGKNFIEQIIEKDIAEGKVPKIVTRFPPEPNGYLTYRTCQVNTFELRTGTASMADSLIIRFDDTNPTKEKDRVRRVDYLQDVKWLGADFGGQSVLCIKLFCTRCTRLP